MHCPKKKKTTGAFLGTRVMAVWVSCLQLSTLPFTCVFTFAFLLHSSQLLPIVQLTLAFTFTILSLFFYIQVSCIQLSSLLLLLLLLFFYIGVSCGQLSTLRQKLPLLVKRPKMAWFGCKTKYEEDFFAE